MLLVIPHGYQLDDAKIDPTPLVANNKKDLNKSISMRFQTLK